MIKLITTDSKKGWGTPMKMKLTTNISKIEWSPTNELEAYNLII